MTENTIYLCMCGYRVPFNVVKYGIRGIIVNGKRGFEERYWLKNGTGVLLDGSKTYIFDNGVVNSYHILQASEVNGSTIYLIGRVSFDVIDVEAYGIGEKE